MSAVVNYANTKMLWKCDEEIIFVIKQSLKIDSFKEVSTLSSVISDSAGKWGTVDSMLFCHGN